MSRPDQSTPLKSHPEQLWADWAMRDEPVAALTLSATCREIDCAIRFASIRGTVKLVAGIDTTNGPGAARSTTTGATRTSRTTVRVFACTGTALLRVSGVLSAFGALSAMAGVLTLTYGAATDGATTVMSNASAPTAAIAAAAGAGDRFVAMLRPAPSSRSMRSEMCLRVANTPGAGIGWRGHDARSAIFVKQSAYGRTMPTNESTQSSHATSRSRSSCWPMN